MAVFIIVGAIIVALYILVDKKLGKNEEAMWKDIKREKERKSKERFEREAEEVFGLMEGFLLLGNCFKPERVPELVGKLKACSLKLGYIVYTAFEGEPLPLAEKKRLGLPTRKKIPSDVPQYLTEEGFKMDYAMELKGAYINATMTSARRQEIASMKRNGTEWMRVAGCKTYEKGIFRVDAPPQLPCPGCQRAFCYCFFMPADYD